MKSMLMAIMAVAVAVTFSAPSFAEEPKEKKDEKKGGHVLVYAGEGDKKAEEAKKPAPKFTDTFGDPPKDDKKKDEKGK
jgi:hypothetical protein